MSEHNAPESSPPREPNTPQSSDPAPSMSPLVEWFSRHGIKAIAVLLLIELIFHAWAVSSTRR